ncbi:MAG: SpoVT / AbrB like domain protein [Methanosaeta sp. PtaU1.Bin060]|jgi:AbrB family looped-hinge helix DNA binding protein|nr:MAG: SpoVT / AbrB like domain protein [Methanosaeta sp. PtaU1.Bin060]
MEEKEGICTVKVMKHRRITLPKAIAEALSLQDGDIVELSVKKIAKAAK